MDPCSCADTCVPSRWTPQEGSGAGSVLTAAWCAFTGVDWGNCAVTAVGRHTCAVPHSPTSGLCTSAYAFTNECCVSWGGGGGNTSSWLVAPVLTAGGSGTTQQVLDRVNWGVPAHCDCNAYGQLLALTGGQEERYLCSCSPDTGTCVPGPTLWALLPASTALGVASAVTALPLLVLCFQLRKRALPLPVATSLSLSSAALFATVTYMGTTPWASFGYLVAHIVVMCTPALPYGLAVVLPSALSLGTYGGGRVWTQFRAECFSILSLSKALKQGRQRLDECRAELASFRGDYEASCARSATRSRTLHALNRCTSALRFYACALSLLCDTWLLFILSVVTRIGVGLVVSIALYAVVWPLLFLFIGPALVRCELATLPGVCTWLTGWRVAQPPRPGNATNTNRWAPSPGLYYLAILTRCCLLCGPMLVAQVLNATALRHGGVSVKPDASRACWASMALQAADGGACLLQLLYAVCSYGVSDLDAWKLPGVGQPAPVLLQSDAPIIAAGTDVELAEAGETHGVVLQTALYEIVDAA